MIRKLALLAAMAVATIGAAQAQAVDPIQVRQTGMGLGSGTFSGVRAVLAGNGDVRPLESSGKAIQRWGALIPSLFPAGSDKGATKASPAIWSDAAGFQQAARMLSQAGEGLAIAAKAGDATAGAAAVKAIGEACGACHKDYRLK